MLQSMTAYASLAGNAGALSWTWEMRGVNARGLDLRLRLPEGQPAFEAAVRQRLTSRLSRGNVSLTLRMARADAALALTLDEAQLDRVLGALAIVQDRAHCAGVTLGAPTAADVLEMRGVVVQGQVEPVADDSLNNTLLAEVDVLIDAFIDMRQTEGAALAAILNDQITRIEGLVTTAARLAEARRDEVRANLAAALRRVIDDAPEVDEGRMTQELALIAVKSDVTEEIDRLTAHIAAARALLAEPAAQGRKLDFLAQEFNREANTLCSKAQSSALTQVGLALKALIDQMREQIQNVE
jgi:uncharacterized protein (TIGR00255 family)